MKYLQNMKVLVDYDVFPIPFIHFQDSHFYKWEFHASLISSLGTTTLIFTYTTNEARAYMGYFNKGGLTLNSGYPSVYAPVLRSPLLFHHNTGLSGPTYNPAQPGAAQSTTNLYFLHHTSPYRHQSRYTVQAPLHYNPQSYPYYSAVSKAIDPSLVPFSSYSIPTVTYASTVSSNGLALILIATLILVALDLVIVRPQKR